MRKIVSVYGDDGNLQVWDMYLDGVWLGSRRTVEQCADDFGTWRFAINPNLF